MSQRSGSLRLGGGTSGSRFSSLLRDFRIGLFGAMLTMSTKKSQNTPAWMTHLLSFVKAVQMLAFVFSSKYGKPWPTYFTQLNTAVSISNLSIMNYVHVTSFIALVFYGAVAWVLVLAALMMYAIGSFLSNKFPFLWPFKVLRIMGGLSAGILFIPLLQMLLAAFACSSPTIEGREEGLSASMWRTYDCGSLGFQVLLVITGALAFLLLCLAMLFAAIFYESDGLSRTAQGIAHGRVDLIMLLLQTILVVLTQTLVAYVSDNIIIAVVSAAGIIWVASFAFFMPYYAHSLNRLNLAGGVVYIWGCLCMIVNNFYLVGGESALFLLMGLPFAAACGFQLADARAASIMGTHPSQLSSAYEVELRARYILHMAVWGHPTRRTTATYGLSEAEAYATPKRGGHARGGGAASSSASSSSSAATAVAAGLENGSGEGSLGPSKAMHTGGGRGGALDVDGEDGGERLQRIRRLIPPSVLLEIQALYRLSALRFRSSSILHSFCSRFYASYMGNRHMQFSHLLQAEKRSPPIDVAYQCFAARKLAEESSTNGGSKLSAITRVAFDKYAAEARHFVQLAANKQLQFWAQLNDTVPDLAKMDKLSSETSKAVREAENCFSELFNINSQSLPTLRLAADFNRYCTCNLEKANVLTAEADRIEDQRSRDHRAEGGEHLIINSESTLDVWSDNAAVFTISASARDIGTLMSTNAGASRLFGHTRLQLERRPAFNALLPPPLAVYYEESMQSYLETGEGPLVDYTRIIFAKHKSGHIFPVLSCIRDSPTNEGPPTFLWIMRDLRSESHYLICGANWSLLAVSPNASALLGMEPTALGNGGVSLLDFIEELAAPVVAEALRSPSGHLLCINVRETEDPDEGGMGGGDGGSVDSNKGVGEGDDDDEGDASTEEDEAVVHANARSVKDAAGGGILGGGSSQRRTQYGAGSSSGGVGIAAEQEGKGGEVVTSIWIHAHLQHVKDEDALNMYVIAYRVLGTSEKMLVEKAEVKREAILNHLKQSIALGFLQKESVATATTAQIGSTMLSSLPPGGGGGSDVAPSMRRTPSFVRSFGGLASTASKRHMLGGGGGGGQSSETSAAAGASDDLDEALRNLLTELPGSTSETAVRSPQGASAASGTGMRDNRGSTLLRSHAMSDGGKSADATKIVSSPASAKKTPRKQRTSTVSDLFSASQVGTPALAGGSSSSSLGSAFVDVPHTFSSSATSDPHHLSSKGSNRSGGSGGGGRSAMSSKGSSKNSETGSDDSGGTDSSSSSAATGRSMQRLRRLLQDVNPPLLPGLKLLMGAGVLVAFLAVGLAVSVVVVTLQSLFSFRQQVSYVHSGVDRLQSKANAILAMQGLLFHARQWRVVSDADLASLRSQMVANASAFAISHNAMFAIAAASPYQSQRDLWTTEYITLTNFNAPPNGVSPRTIVYNLAEVGNLFTSTIEQMAVDRIDKFGELTAYASLNFVNFDFMRRGNGHEVLSESLISGYATLISSTLNVEFTQIIIYSCMVSVIVLLSVVVFLPILCITEANSNQIMVQFVTLPPAVRRNVLILAASRVRHLRSTYDEGDDDDLGDNEDLLLPDDPVLAATMTEFTAASADPSTNAGASTKYWDKVLLEGEILPSQLSADLPLDAAAAGGGSASPSHAGPARGAKPHHRRGSSSSGPEKRTWQKNSRAFCLTVGTFLAPLACVLIMFTIVFAFFYIRIMDIFTLSSIAMAASVRASCARQALVDLNKLEYIATEARYITSSYFIIIDSFECVVWNTKLLAYGNRVTDANHAASRLYRDYTAAVEGGATSALSATNSSKVRSALFADACAFLSSVSGGGANSDSGSAAALASSDAAPPSFNLTACYAFSGGIMKQGFVALIIQWYEYAKQMSERQLRAGTLRGTDPFTNRTFLDESLGYMPPSNTFNYSTIKCLPSEGCDFSQSWAYTAEILPATELPDPSFDGDYEAPSAAAWSKAHQYILEGKQPPQALVMEMGAPVNGSELLWAGFELNDPRMLWLEDADRLYLTPGLLALANIYADETDSLINSSTSFITIFVPVYMSAFLLFVMLYFIPQVRKANINIQTKRGMLLYLPLEVVAKIKSIRKLIDSITSFSKESSKGRGSSPSSDHRK